MKRSEYDVLMDVYRTEGQMKAILDDINRITTEQSEEISTREWYNLDTELSDANQALMDTRRALHKLYREYFEERPWNNIELPYNDYN
jgi:hypothetical protein